MKLKGKVAATVLAAALAMSQMAAPADAYIHYIKKKKVVVHHGGSSANKWLLACIFGSAFGLIGAAYLKKTGQLTIDEAQLIAFSCGLGAFPVVANFQQPAAVSAKN